MALLGAQLVITLVMVSIMQKIGSHYSFARWLLCSTGLVRYLYPTDEELKTLAGISKDKSKAKKHGKGHEQNGKVDTFHVPRNLDIQLDTAKVSPLDVIHLRYYFEYQWLVDLALYSVFVYAVSEIYLYFFPLKDEINLSMLWCLLVSGFSIKILFKLTLQYFQGEESIGERSTCLVAGGAYMLIAMMVLIVDERILEVGLDTAYVSFNNSASIYLSNQGLSSSGPASQLILKLCFAVWCGLLGSLFTFPGMRMGRMHKDSLKYCKDSKIYQLLLNLSFSLPFILVLLWIRPISRDYLTERVFSGMDGPLMTDASFETFRLGLVVFTAVLRVSLMPIYLQAYLNMAYSRIEELKKEAGRITNVDLQKKIAAIFYYLCVVTLQYVAPIILCLFFTFCYKTLGGYTWQGSYYNPQEEECSMEPSALPVAASEELEQTIVQSAQNFQVAMESIKNIFTTDVFRGIFGFATWWTCFSLFTSSSMGMIYQSYFQKS